MVNYDLFCRRCHHYQFDIEQGILCGLNQQKPDFEGDCSQFVQDPDKQKRLVNEQYRISRAEVRSEALGESDSFFAPEKKGIQKGVIGGIIMMVIAVVWFVVGWAVGYIFFYPPFLFLIGLYALVKGLVSGNISGKRNAVTGN